MPAENSYFEIGGDATRFWSTARKIYITPDDAGLAAWAATGRTPIAIISEAELSNTLANIGLGPLAPIPSPAPVDPATQIAALTDQVNALQAALIASNVITETAITNQMAALTTAAPVVTKGP